MPELPDLQAFSKNLTSLIAGKKIKQVRIPYGKKLKTPAKDFSKVLEGRKVKKIYRQGKELYFEVDSGDTLALHLMLRGQLFFFEGEHDKKYPIIELAFADGSGLVMTDFQGQATPTLNPEEHDGVDAMSEEVDFAFLKKKFNGSKASLKNVLLDQHFIRGIGNAYADEILWHAGISPFSIAGKIPGSSIRKLAKAIKKVLKDAEKKILKAKPDIISGEVRDFLVIHNAKLKESPTGGKIKIETKGGRKTYFTDEQELFV
jgi:formamidopyrimidine-DNA glycosylase